MLFFARNRPKSAQVSNCLNKLVSFKLSRARWYKIVCPNFVVLRLEINFSPILIEDNCRNTNSSQGAKKGLVCVQASWGTRQTSGAKIARNRPTRDVIVLCDLPEGIKVRRQAHVRSWIQVGFFLKNHLCTQNYSDSTQSLDPPKQFRWEIGSRCTKETVDLLTCCCRFLTWRNTRNTRPRCIQLPQRPNTGRAGWSGTWRKCGNGTHHSHTRDP